MEEESFHRGMGERPTPACHFEDSDRRCWKPAGRGVCVRPASGASALVQHADMAELCRRNPPFGFRALCKEPEVNGGETLRMLQRFRDPAVCKYRTCALVGSGGGLLGARAGAAIDAHDAVLRLNLAPDGPQTALRKEAPHRHVPTWVADVGARTTWRVMAMEGYGYFKHYPRFWLGRPKGWGKHRNMSGIPQTPLLAVACHTPTNGVGRCRAERLQQVFDHAESASYLVNPLLIHEWTQAHFRGVRNQKVLSTGMWAIAFASQLCGEVHIYGYGNGGCLQQCYHYYDCGETRGKAGVNQSVFFTDPKSSGGYHNFSAQAQVLHELAAKRVVVPHWGTCAPSNGDPPAEYLNRPSSRGHGAHARRARRASGGGGGGGGGGKRRKRGSFGSKGGGKAAREEASSGETAGGGNGANGANEDQPRGGKRRVAGRAGGGKKSSRAGTATAASGA